MKQLGLALHNYHDAMRAFPPGTLWEGSQPNWRIHILPFMEEGNAYDKFGYFNNLSFYTHTAFSGNDSIIYSLRIDGYVCPSSPFGLTNVKDLSLSAQSGDPTKVGMLVDYVGISGATPDPAGRTNVCTGDFLSVSSSQCKTGMLVPFESKKFKDCTDGTSNTIVIAEQSGQVSGKEVSANYLGAWFSYANVNDTMWTAATPLPFSSATTGSGGWYPGGVTTVRNPPNAFWNSGGTSSSNNAYSANTVINSYHAAGINVLLTDGSVRYVSETIDLPTLRQLCVRDDGKVVGEY